MQSREELHKLVDSMPEETAIETIAFDITGE